MHEISFLYVEEAFNSIKPGYNGSDFSIKEDKEKAKKFFANGGMSKNVNFNTLLEFFNSLSDQGKKDFNKKWLLYIKKNYLNSII